MYIFSTENLAAPDRVNQDQTARSVQSDLDLYFPLKPIAAVSHLSTEV